MPGTLAKWRVHYNVVNVAYLLGRDGKEVISNDFTFSVQQFADVRVFLTGDDLCCSVFIEPVHDVAFPCRWLKNSLATDAFVHHHSLNDLSRCRVEVRVVCKNVVHIV